MKVLVTGTAGFIGSFTALRLVERGHAVIGLDSINDYYDVNIKYGRLERDGIDRSTAKTGEFVWSNKFPDYGFIRLNLIDKQGIEQLFEKEQFDMVCHLAAQAGVRYSLTNPHAYIDSNIVGFLNLLESCRHHQIKHLVYASSSSVYGLNETFPFSTHDNVDHPISLYAASKKSNELMAHTYSHLYGIPTTGLRFFTVYGPWGRPDMAYWSFLDNILNGKQIKVFNFGKNSRDFTYIEDIVNGVIASLRAQSLDRCEIVNLGNNNPVKLMEFIEILEDLADRKAVKELVAAQPGDVVSTYADITMAGKKLGFKPKTSLRQGLERFVAWYRNNPELTDAVRYYRHLQEEEWARSDSWIRGKVV